MRGWGKIFLDPGREDAMADLDENPRQIQEADIVSLQTAYSRYTDRQKAKLLKKELIKELQREIQKANNENTPGLLGQALVAEDD